MPETLVLFFAEADRSAPLLAWLDDQQPKVQDKCLVRIERLAECGHELRRPDADFLRDRIYELRAKHMGVNYRMLYFFHEGKAVLSLGLTKEGKVPDKDIDLAIRRSIAFKNDPEAHTYREEE